MTSSSEELQRDRAWSSSAVWIDVNADQRPDLYIGNVAQYDPGITCLSETRRPDYCTADAYVPLHDQLLLNFGTTDGGDIVFEDASHDWNLAAVKAPTLGVYAADLSGDGWPDVYATSFGLDNAFWINRRGQEFSERSGAAGVASSFLGQYRDSLGVDAADVDSDGDIDLVVAHARGEPHQLYLNDGRGDFLADAMIANGEAEAHSGAGLVVFDANADGRHDLFVANGAVRQRQIQLDASDALPLRQSNALFVQQPANERLLLASGPVSDNGNSQSDGAATAGGAVTPPAHDEVDDRKTDAMLRFEQSSPSAAFLTPRPQVSRKRGVRRPRQRWRCRPGHYQQWWAGQASAQHP